MKGSLRRDGGGCYFLLSLFLANRYAHSVSVYVERENAPAATPTHTLAQHTRESGGHAEGGGSDL